MIRKFIPTAVKKQIRLKQRWYADKKSGALSAFSEKDKNKPTKEPIEIIRLNQAIYYNPLAANKVTNISIAIKEIERVIIAPGEIFSLWEILGNPTPEKGYQTGRNIIDNQLKEDIGGGLCQVAGILYHLALLSGMTIYERHAHTLDLYEEDKRYTPLGTDAAVVHGYKDLRFKNETNATIWFDLAVTQTNFTGIVLANLPLPVYDLNFVRKEFDDYRTIDTFRSLPQKQEILINQSKYKLSLK